MVARLVVAALATASLMPQPQASNPCTDFDALYAAIRDGTIDRAVALARVRALVPQIRDYYVARDGTRDAPPWRFPVKGYGAESIGGRNGSGYQPSGYDWFDGMRSKGHPGHDLFIHDRNQDELDDQTGQPVDILAIASGAVVAYSPDWDPASKRRGGRYVYIYSPGSQGLFYYAHARTIVVRPGDIVQAGQTIGTVGRSGRNAAMPRSPTHLHVMFLAIGADGYPRPRDIYADLIRLARKERSRAGGWQGAL